MLQSRQQKYLYTLAIFSPSSLAFDLVTNRDLACKEKTMAARHTVASRKKIVTKLELDTIIVTNKDRDKLKL